MTQIITENSPTIERTNQSLKSNAQRQQVTNNSFSNQQFQQVPLTGKTFQNVHYQNPKHGSNEIYNARVFHTLFQMARTTCFDSNDNLKKQLPLVY